MAITELALDDGVTPADLDPFALVARQLGHSERFERDSTRSRRSRESCGVRHAGSVHAGHDFRDVRERERQAAEGRQELVPQLQHPLPDRLGSRKRTGR